MTVAGGAVDPDGSRILSLFPGILLSPLGEPLSCDMFVFCPAIKLSSLVSGESTVELLCWFIGELTIFDVSFN